MAADPDDLFERMESAGHAAFALAAASNGLDVSEGRERELVAVAVAAGVVGALEVMRADDTPNAKP